MSAAARMRALRARRVECGACVDCGGEMDKLGKRKGRRTCETCLERARKRWAAWEKRHPWYSRRNFLVWIHSGGPDKPKG